MLYLIAYFAGWILWCAYGSFKQRKQFDAEATCIHGIAGIIWPIIIAIMIPTFLGLYMARTLEKGIKLFRRSHDDDNPPKENPHVQL